ncbi:voltage-gated potassium channel [Aaosphaeria arxii CBS 175.79]|uniref:Voltage-gated potassium channel n=1 Tax=Aaosphaeria arxii CBS 175.79 TaxID=1450172 RepID=A0A6A5Y9W0_9PLEO|nr:voltage-gated potassium channel [Aaosphaeria arxii CBS 175.79]KAF2022036.1 voltage-gated potassium channel [Aaosphaeria arxii CBS 175.79]
MSHIDPGLDEPAQEAAQDVEQNGKSQEEQKQADEEEQTFLDPSRWWFASTACPLIAGTFGPMANAFSVCALVEKWRVYIPAGADEAHGLKVEDPKWLIAVNSVSLVFALVANLALLLNMARRVSFAIAQPITIIGWYLASFLLIVLVSVASSGSFRIQPRKEHALSQAYYYGIIAASLYFIISTLMIITVYGAYKGHYPKEFRLTPSQRTLMLQTISFMIYLLLGALVFSKIEGWNFLDGVYWADFTLLTVGIGGEYVPTTHTGRSLLFPFAIGGIVMVGLVVGSIRSLVLERGKEKMSARFTEHQRERAISSVNFKQGTVNLGIFHTIRLPGEAVSEVERREQEFQIMRKVQTTAEHKRRYTALAMSSIAALTLWFLGAVVFMESEKPQGWSYFVSLYFAYTSLLTIGYGDYTLSSNAGKAFFVFWSLLAVPTLTILISNMGDTVIKSFKELTFWLGSFTLLPEKPDARSNQQPRSRLSGITGRLAPREEKRRSTKETQVDRIAKLLEADELEEAAEAGERGDSIQRDRHFYHYILVKEIRGLMRDLDASPPKQYSYDEWKYYLRLIGESEDDPTHHRRPKSSHSRSSGSPDLGTADGGTDDDASQAWSWLGVRSPLMGSTPESQWLLQRLSETLENEMRLMHSSHLSKRQQPPPISTNDLKSRTESCSGVESGANAEKRIGVASARKTQERHRPGV